MKLLKISEAATLLKISRACAYRLVKDNQLPVVVIGHSMRVPSDGVEDMITIPEVAKRLQISPSTAYWMAQHNKFPVVRYGKKIVRVPVSIFHKWLEETIRKSS